MDKIKIRELFFSNIKKRIHILVESSKSLRVLSGAFVVIASQKEVLIDLNAFTASWDYDRRPILKNEKKIKYLNHKKLSLMFEDFSMVEINSLDLIDLYAINSYFETMVPLPSSQSVIIDPSELE